VIGRAAPAAAPAPPSAGAIARRRRASAQLRRSVLIALVSTVVVFGLLGFAITNAPGWALVQPYFFDPEEFRAALPGIVNAFWTNVALFLIAEVFILVLGLLIAVLRSLREPVFFPLRLIAIVYTDLFRAVPGLLVVYMLGLGIPLLDIPGVPNDPFFWAVVCLTLIYSAYVSEVYRAGIESIHPSQDAAARSLGLSRVQSLRYVVLPQAVRRVIPPLLNDFIGLQKDTVLVSYIGVVEIFRTAYIKQAAHFNMTPYVATALVFIVVTLPLARFTDWLLGRSRGFGPER
jgi:polar amino acid transport system permease protein